MHTIELSNIVKDFQQADKLISLFRGCSYTFKQGQTYAITGVSGTGKSTLLHIIAGIEKPTSGTVLYDGHAIHKDTNTRLSSYVRDKIGIIFQYAYLINTLNVVENVEIKALIAGLSLTEARRQAEELLSLVGLIDKRYTAAAALSGGEQQRVAIARALMLRPPFIVADELTAHLDSENKKSIIDLLISRANLFGCGVIMSSHDPEAIQKMRHQLTIHQGLLCHV